MAAKKIIKKVGEDNAFNRWIESLGGRRKAAIFLDTSDWTIANWCKGTGNPDVPTFVKIINLTRNTQHALTFDDIYKCTTANRKDVQKLK